MKKKNIFHELDSLKKYIMYTIYNFYVTHSSPISINMSEFTFKNKL